MDALIFTRNIYVTKRLPPLDSSFIDFPRSASWRHRSRFGQNVFLQSMKSGITTSEQTLAGPLSLTKCKLPSNPTRLQNVQHPRLQKWGKKYLEASSEDGLTKEQDRRKAVEDEIPVTRARSMKAVEHWHCYGFIRGSVIAGLKERNRCQRGFDNFGDMLGFPNDAAIRCHADAKLVIDDHVSKSRKTDWGTPVIWVCKEAFQRSEPLVLD